jgi:hypothetical protein
MRFLADDGEKGTGSILDRENSAGSAALSSTLPEAFCQFEDSHKHSRRKLTLSTPNPILAEQPKISGPAYRWTGPDGPQRIGGVSVVF